MVEDPAMAGTQGETSGAVSPDADIQPKKKKGNFSFKAFRQLFSRKKRKSSEDAGKAKSTTDMMSSVNEEDEESSQLSNNKTMSLSHDSVFSADKPRDNLQDDMRKSMEALPTGSRINPFAAELSKAVKVRRRSDDEDEDEALPASPKITTTADIIQNGLKSTRETSMSQESDQSLLSMGDSSGEELEEEFFKDQWGKPTSGSRSNLADLSGSGDLDLDIVKSSSSLDTKMAIHKREVRPKNTRPRSKHPGSVVVRTTSPKPPAGAIQVLPQLKENKKEDANQSIEEENEDETSDSMPASPEPKVDPKPQENVTEQNNGAGDFRQVVLRKASMKETKTENDPKDSSMNSVVMRRESSGVKADPTKRTTIAVGSTSEMTMFGERKLNKRSSLGETKSWEEGKEEKSSTDSNSEFAQVFSKFQRKTSVKLIEVQKETEKLEMERQKELEKVKQVMSSPSKRESTSPKETKKQVMVTKPEANKVENKPPSKPNTSVKTKENPHVEKSKSAFIIDKSKPAVGKIEPSKDNKSNDKNKADPIKKQKVDDGIPQPKPADKVLVIEKVQPVMNKNNEDKENEKVFKRNNPLPVNRARSQTLPEQPVCKEVLEKQVENEASPPPIKKANSTENALVSASEKTPSPANSPQRSSSVLVKSSSRAVAPQRLTIKDNNNSGEPAWIAMARRKTKAFDEGDKSKKDEENEAKKQDEHKSDLEELRNKRQSKVLDMVNKWGN